MGIDEYLIALRRHWRVVVAALVLAVAVALVTTTVAPPRAAAVSYNGTAVVLNSGSIAGSVPGTIPGAGIPSLETVATLATLQPVVQRVADAIGYEGDPQLLAARVRVVVDPSSPGILRITASSGDAQEAALIANTFATELIDYLQANRKRTAEDNLAFVNQQLEDVSSEIVQTDQELQTASPEEANVLQARRTALTNRVSVLSGLYQQYLGESLEPPAFELVESATPVPVTAEGLQPPRSRTARVLIAAILGLLGGFAIALVLQRFDKRIRTAETAERALHAPVLAEIPLIPKNERGGIVVVEHPHSAASEALRLLGAGLVPGQASAGLNGGRRREGRREDRRSKVVLVTSAAPGEGKTTLVANLAVVLGETGKMVLVLSCDFRRPTIHDLLEVPNLYGLADVLREPTSPQILNGCVLDTRFDGVSVAPSGASFDRPGEILGSDAMPRALREARARADVVLIDTAPILAASDAAHLIPGADEVLVVARAGVATTSLAHRTREVLERLQSPQIGVVLNGAQETALPPGYREYFRRIPKTPEEEEGLGETPPYRVPREADTV
jgi:capsular exopolysaccharide synthesis family protein